MYSLPSTSKMWDPWPRVMNGGFPPTLRYARTGELTPPGMVAHALRNSSSDLECLMVTQLSCYTLFCGAGPLARGRPPGRLAPIQEGRVQGDPRGPGGPPHHPSPPCA